MGLLDVVLAGLGVAMVVAIGRVAVGPSRADRALGLDFGFAILVAGIAVLAVRLDSPMLVNLVLGATLIGFLGTVAIARLVERRSPRPPAGGAQRNPRSSGRNLEEHRPPAGGAQRSPRSSGRNLEEQ